MGKDFLYLKTPSKEGGVVLCIIHIKYIRIPNYLKDMINLEAL